MKRGAKVIASFDVIVIGGGWGGLGTGALLAHKGANVLLLESQPTLGGRASYSERDGFLVDYGIHGHRFGHAGAAASLYECLGREIDLIEPGPGLIRHSGRNFDAPTDPLGFIRTGLMGRGDKAALVAALALVAAHNPAKSYYRPLVELLPGRLGGEAKFFMSVLTGAGLISRDLNVVSAGEFVSFLRAAARSGGELLAFPREGCRQHVRTLGGIIGGCGEVRTGFRVQRVLLEKGAVAGVEGSGGVLRSGAVVAAVPLPTVAALMPTGTLARPLEDAMRRILPTSGLSWDVGLRRPVTDAHTATITEPMVLGSFNSNFDSSICPPGKQFATWCMPLPRLVPDTSGRWTRMERLMRRSVFEMFPGLEENILWERMLRLQVIDGALPSAAQPWPARPAPGDSGVPGLFFAGDTVGVPGQGGDIAFRSALECVPEVLAHLR